MNGVTVVIPINPLGFWMMNFPCPFSSFSVYGAMESAGTSGMLEGLLWFTIVAKW